MGKELVRLWKRRKGSYKITGPQLEEASFRFTQNLRLIGKNDSQLNEIDVSEEISLKC